MTFRTGAFFLMNSLYFLIHSLFHVIDPSR
nr:MAG TPA: hypothetical protein [Caudoviricetes sp.]